nr:MAG TPA: hypothetical protein [Caudoviricetes sp.]
MGCLCCGCYNVRFLGNRFRENGKRCKIFNSDVYFDWNYLYLFVR